MRDILATVNRELLGQFVRSDVLLAFDYDGTLAPIVRQPEQAEMRLETRALLDRITSLYPVAVVSGRRRDDVRRRLPGNDLIGVIGNHGIEPSPGCDGYVEAVRAWRSVVVASVASLEGVLIEDKGFSLAIHFRASREKKRARAIILEVAASLAGVRVVGGKQVVNILPREAPHKGAALERERDRLRCDGAIYVGDDDTDEDVFAMHRSGRLLAIRVGAKRRSAAPHFIVNQRAIDKLLSALIELRHPAAPYSGASPHEREAGKR